MTKNNTSSFKNWLLSPWAILAGLVIGVYTGVAHKNFAKLLVPFGETYLALLQMCVIPILISAVISGMGKLVSEGDANRYVKKLLMVFLFGLLTASGLGIFTGVVFKPGSTLDKDSRIIMGKILAASEMGQKPSPVLEDSPGIMDFLFSMVPKNVFAAVAKDQNLGILFFSIILGVALGFVRTSSSQVTLSVIEGLYDSFQKMIAWIMYGLPFGLCCFFAAQISQIGLEILGALIKLVLLIYIASFVLMVFYQLIIAKTVKQSFFRSFLALKESLIVAFGTSSSFAAIPSALRSLPQELKLDKETTRMVIPLGMSINPQGNALYFAVSAIFIAQIYGSVLGIQSYFIILIGAVLAGMAATGAPGTASLAMIAIVLEPLRLPVESAIILLMAIDPIVDPVLTMVNVHSNCTAAAIVAVKREESMVPIENELAQAVSDL